jgi:3-phosphoshikimate 1-carboxyvinyltransferase
VPSERVPAMSDEYPLLAVAAAFAAGETRMQGLGDLQAMGCDRLATLSAGLAANRVVHRIERHDLIVSGSEAPAGGGAVITHSDHRIATAFLVMGLASRAPVSLDDTTSIAACLPSFIPTMRRLGAAFT